jgi:hypothetical protein
MANTSGLIELPPQLRTERLNDQIAAMTQRIDAGLITPQDVPPRSAAARRHRRGQSWTMARHRHLG